LQFIWHYIDTVERDVTFWPSQYMIVKFILQCSWGCVWSDWANWVSW